MGCGCVDRYRAAKSLPACPTLPVPAPPCLCLPPVCACPPRQNLVVSGLGVAFEVCDDLAKKCALDFRCFRYGGKRGQEYVRDVVTRTRPPRPCVLGLCLSVRWAANSWTRKRQTDRQTISEEDNEGGGAICYKQGEMTAG